MMMNRMWSRKSLAMLSLGLVATAVTMTACQKEEDDQNAVSSYQISGQASGDQEVPAVSSTASAQLTGQFNTEKNELTYVINWTGLSGEATAIHFHGPAAAGEVADPVEALTISTNGTAGVASGTIIVPDSLESNVINGKWYYNIHTATYPDGEIRGQVSAAPNQQQ